MNNLLKYVESSFIMSLGNIRFENVNGGNGTSSILKKGHYRIFVSPLRYQFLKDKFELYMEMVKKAISVYENVLDGYLTFETQTELYKSDFTIYWAKTNNENAGLQFDEYLSETASRRAFAVGVVDPVTQQPLDENKVYHVILHELGHLLGLGHSYQEGDIMSTTGKWSTKLSKNDIFVLKLLYSLPEKAIFSNYRSYIIKEIEKFCATKKITCEDKNLTQALDEIADYKKLSVMINVNLPNKKK